MASLPVTATDISQTPDFDNNNVSSMHVDDAVDDEARVKLSVSILSEVQIAQNSNGVRQRNYLRYRQYCTRRLRRLRQSVRFKHGRGNYVAKRISSEIATSERHLLIPLFNAERAFSYAMQLKQELTRDNSHSRFHLRRRLAKAALWSNELHMLCQEVADTRTALEAEAYSSSIQGHLALEKEELAAASTLFTLATKLHTSLASIGDAEQRELCKSRINAFEPNLRYCSYMLGKKKKSSSSSDSPDIQSANSVELDLQVNNIDEVLRSKLESAVAESRSQEAAALDHVAWKGKSLPLRSEQLRLVIIETRHLDLNDSSNDDAAFSHAFERFDKAQSIITSELSRLAAVRPRGAHLEAQENEMRELTDYLSFNKLRVLLQRNTALVHSLTQQYEVTQQPKLSLASSSAGIGVSTTRRKQVRPDELVVLFEKLIDTMSEVLCLGTQSSNDSSGGDEDEDLHKEANARTMYWQAFRVFYCGESFRTSRQYDEANAFYQRAISFAISATDKVKQWNGLRALITSLVKLQRQASLSAVRVRAESQLDKIAKAKQHSHNTTTENRETEGIVSLRNNIPVIDQLDEYNSVSLASRSLLNSGESHTHQLVLSEFPPGFVGTTCKPILFDLAWHSLHYPDMTQFCQAHTTRKSWLGRIWG